MLCTSSSTARLPLHAQARMRLTRSRSHQTAMLLRCQTEPRRSGAVQSEPRVHRASARRVFNERLGSRPAECHGFCSARRRRRRCRSAAWDDVSTVRLSTFKRHLPATETRALGEYGTGDAELDVGAGCGAGGRRGRERLRMKSCNATAGGEGSVRVEDAAENIGSPVRRGVHRTLTDCRPHSDPVTRCRPSPKRRRCIREPTATPIDDDDVSPPSLLKTNDVSEPRRGQTRARRTWQLHGAVDISGALDASAAARRRRSRGYRKVSVRYRVRALTGEAQCKRR